MTKKRLLQGVTLTWILVVVVLLSPVPALADYQAFVGYADNTRPSPFFPLPWSGSGGVNFFAGNPPGATPPAGTYDSGAVMIKNTGATSLLLNSISVHVPTWTGGGIGTNTADMTNEWLAFAGSFPRTVLPGQVVIFTQDGNINGNNSFDTSDFGLAGLNSTSNCDPGNAFAVANPSTCASIAPTVTVTVGGVSTLFTDSGQVLDTGGFDVATASVCPGPGTPGDCNESLQWRLIGTTGIGNPGGTVPEPSTLLLLGSGLVGLGGFAWRRHRG